ncbi:class I SAM-dependent methyltransferase [Sulfuriroseicoccus oceanibius]|uniref:S-adenosyl-L-methionine-dependent methyltransferase n=1 Tax=Sulfuriroseicoccus oceanibius TaxID=2707525 RepID=A0A6B3LAZ1_9BACT|nr:class I SAM-dependent methyltransferase [Sulfuriroseicoccus oceanibius]QQL45779.1 class I SAM-dependent methyltransferase [Sulfuriroseicoccus oceanibius]
MRLLVFALLSLLLLPCWWVGVWLYIVPVWRQRGKVSGTTYEPFTTRLLMHLIGTRDDPLIAQLAGHLPACSPSTLRWFILPQVWICKVSGFIPTPLRFPPPEHASLNCLVSARCEFLDRSLSKHLPHCKQLVILGAGWDTRAYQADASLDLFEVDAPATQAVKRRAIKDSGIPHDHVHFVPCDFESQRWLDALTDHGFNPELPTYVHWEGVTMYLERAAIESTLDQFSQLPQGSILALDYLAEKWLHHTTGGRLTKFMVNAFYGEPFRSGLPADTDSLLKPFGLRILRHQRLHAPGKPPYGGLLTLARRIEPDHKINMQSP